MRSGLPLLLLVACTAAPPAPPAGPPDEAALVRRLTERAVPEAGATLVVERLQALRAAKDARRAGTADDAAVREAHEALERACRESSGRSCEELLYRPSGGAR